MRDNQKMSGKLKNNKEIRLGYIDAVIFDMDGVITETATVHANAWKQMLKVAHKLLMPRRQLKP